MIQFKFGNQAIPANMRTMACKGLGYHMIAREIMVLYPGTNAFRAGRMTREIFWALSEEEWGGSISPWRTADLVAELLLWVEMSEKTCPLYTQAGGAHLRTPQVIHGLLAMARGYSKLGW